ncbi:hypothetical protein Micbo1qcDRAFT_169013 [Microdochium bolleyi]|uniref:Homeobox domain-containing protein n=1 Tax=Microdochium bolleyi TaxID=196109 RepID=A0A136IM52_9PEZI|nr:hypothetical protein Micbo1qcDRAFT_169013 [Microdochium bolleyi]
MDTDPPIIAESPTTRTRPVMLDIDNNHKDQDKTSSTGARRTAPRLPQAAVHVLEQWLVEHRDTPYVSALEQDVLKARTGLHRSQIKTWFANARKRRRIENLVRPSLSLAAVDQHQKQHAQLFRPGEQPGGNRSPQGPSHFNTTVFPQLANVDPFERWLLMGPEHEPATVKAIVEAIKLEEKQREDSASPAGAPGASDFDRNLVFPPKDKPIRPIRSQCSWPSSLEIRSYAANKYSVTSDQWKPSHPNPNTRNEAAPGSARSVDYRGPSRPARRHRRAEASLTGASVRGHQRAATVGGGSVCRINTTNTSTANNTSKRRFQCTFCTDAFVKRHDWQRHEKSQHLALEWWTCCPDDGLAATYVDPETAKVSCVFCGLRDPDRPHLDDTHGLGACASRSEAERTFYRKDHLRQHLRLMHADCVFMPAMEAWRTELIEVKSRCGFCAVEFETWPTRVNHLASHFRAGVTMDKWQGDWGLEPAVAANLERATLPADRVAATAGFLASPSVAPAATPPTPWPGPSTDSPMADAELGGYFDASSDVFPLATTARAAAPPSIISDASGLPWDLSFADFETLPSASVLDPWDDYSFSAASAMDFFGGGHQYQQQQPQHLYMNDMMPPPLSTPPIHESQAQTDMPHSSTSLFMDGYDGPASALLMDLGGGAQQQQQELSVEDFLGVPPYGFDGTAVDGLPGDMAPPFESDVDAVAPQINSNNEQLLATLGMNMPPGWPPSFGDDTLVGGNTWHQGTDGQ